MGNQESQESPRGISPLFWPVVYEGIVHGGALMHGRPHPSHKEVSRKTRGAQENQRRHKRTKGNLRDPIRERATGQRDQKRSGGQGNVECLIAQTISGFLCSVSLSWNLMGSLWFFCVLYGFPGHSWFSWALPRVRDGGDHA